MISEGFPRTVTPVCRTVACTLTLVTKFHEWRGQLLVARTKRDTVNATNYPSKNQMSPKFNTSRLLHLEIVAATFTEVLLRLT